MIARLLVVLMLIIGLLGGAAYVYFKGRGAGYNERDLMCKAEVSAIESAKMEAERQAHALKEKSRILANRIAEQALAAEERLRDQQKRYASEIKRLASAHRVALNAELTRVLNASTRHDITERFDGSTGDAAAKPDAGNAPVADDRIGLTGGASEKSVANWISNAKSMYETCRTRLHGLQAWAKEVAQ